ncbi:unnamed protein product [Urochloa humidicola]
MEILQGSPRRRQLPSQPDAVVGARIRRPSGRICALPAWGALAHLVASRALLRPRGSSAAECRVGAARSTSHGSDAALWPLRHLLIPVVPAAIGGDARPCSSGAVAAGNSSVAALRFVVQAMGILLSSPLAGGVPIIFVQIYFVVVPTNRLCAAALCSLTSPAMSSEGGA